MAHPSGHRERDHQRRQCAPRCPEMVRKRELELERDGQASREENLARRRRETSKPHGPKVAARISARICPPTDSKIRRAADAQLPSGTYGQASPPKERINDNTQNQSVRQRAAGKAQARGEPTTRRDRGSRRVWRVDRRWIVLGGRQAAHAQSARGHHLVRG